MANEIRAAVDGLASLLEGVPGVCGYTASRRQR